MKKKYLGTKILQIFAVIVLIFALISGALFFLVNQEKRQAQEDNAIPQMFGINYIPMSQTFDNIAQKGDLLFAEAVAADTVTTGDAIIFETPMTFFDNSIYGNFSLGIVNRLEETDDGIVAYVAVNGESEKEAAIAAGMIKGRATGLLLSGGFVIDQMTGNMGLVWFLALPVFCFVLLQLIVVILRVIHNGREEADFEEDFEDDDEENEEEEETFRSSVFQSRVSDLTLDDEEFPREDKKAVEAGIKSQTVSTLKGEYLSRSSLLKPFMEEPAADESAPAEENTPAVEEETQKQPEQDSHEAARRSVQEMMKQATIEFDLSEIRRRLHQEKPEKPEESELQDLLPKEEPSIAAEPAQEEALTAQQPAAEPLAEQSKPQPEERTSKIIMEMLEQGKKEETPKQPEPLTRGEDIDVDSILADIIKQVQEQKRSGMNE